MRKFIRRRLGGPQRDSRRILPGMAGVPRNVTVGYGNDLLGTVSFGVEGFLKSLYRLWPGHMLCQTFGILFTAKPSYNCADVPSFTPIASAFPIYI